MEDIKIGIIVYPGSNCIEETRRYFPNSFYIWHETEIINEEIDLLVIPGGFAFGDREYDKATEKYKINPGKMAKNSPVSKVIFKAAENKIPILGICNGFQILIKLGLLPGSLNLNTNKRFTCKKVMCMFDGIFKEKCSGLRLKLDVANSFGNYSPCTSYKELKNDNRIFLRYDDENYIEENGSFENIAGICNRDFTIFGMMPHPERTINSNLFKDILYSIITKPVEKSNLEEDIKSLMNSEHISYKSTRKFLKNLYTQGKHVIQGPGENAGIVDIGNGYGLAIRIESHNHPVFIDPYNGASTGVGGIIRDIFTMGARPIALLDFLRFGRDENSGKLLKESVRGIADYGNCIGIANVGGDCFRESTYSKNPLVNICCMGIVNKDNIVYGNVKNNEDLLIYVGSKTGSDGINGAKMASQTFTDDTDLEDLKSNIQKGDPFLEKLLLEACLEINELKLAEGMQDMGAGGLLCSSVEMVQRGRNKYGKNFGCVINIDNIPGKGGVDRCDKLISESQERMLLAVKQENFSKVYKIFKKWDLEYHCIGQVDMTGMYTVIDNKNKIFFKENMEDFDDPTQDWELKKVNKDAYKGDRILESDTDLWSNYDSTVGGRTSTLGRGEINASVLDIYEIGKKLIITWGENFEICHKKMTVMSGKPLGIVNCLNYGHPGDTLGDMKEFLEDLTEKCKEFEVPILGGNVSLYNATDDVSIRPTPILVMIGLV